MDSEKEKAEELVDKFRKYVDDGRHNGFYSGEITFENQKQCALIAVEEIIDSLQIKNYSQADQYEYWSEVKYYIEKL